MFSKIKVQSEDSERIQDVLVWVKRLQTGRYRYGDLDMIKWETWGKDMLGSESPPDLRFIIKGKIKSPMLVSSPNKKGWWLH